jgi:hypothetical protein
LPEAVPRAQGSGFLGRLVRAMRLASVAGAQLVDDHFPAGLLEPVVIIAPPGPGQSRRGGGGLVPDVSTVLPTTPVEGYASYLVILSVPPRRLGIRPGTLCRLSVTGGVIMAAGIVLAATFAALELEPTVYLTEVGTAVAIGVLLDTLLVRTVLVPAALLTIGERVWWPTRPGHQTAAVTADREAATV